MPARLEYDSPSGHASFALELRDVTIGRADDNDVVLTDQSVSRHHARLVRGGSGWQVVDVGSRFGTCVPGRADASAPLQDGDVIIAGTFPLVFRSEAAARVPWAAHAPAPAPEAHPTADDSLGAMVLPARDFSALAGTSPGVPDAVQELARVRKLLRVLAQAAEEVRDSDSAADLLARLVDIVFEHLPAERAFVLLWDPVSKRLVERIARERDPKSGQDERPLHVSRRIADKVFRERVAVITTDAQSDERFRGGESIVAMGIRSAMAAPIGHGDSVEGLIAVDTPLHVRAFDEHDLDLLAALGSHAAVALQKSRLQEAAVADRMARQRLERYHSPAVVARITQGGLTGGTLLAEEREVTVLFADVVGFTSRCESLEPGKVAELLNRCFSRMADVIFRHDGTLDKFIGDCVMAVFGAPLPREDHAVAAVETALEMLEAIAELNEELPEDERLGFRVGLSSGRVVAGDIGSVRRSDYTVLGATVNLASRMESSVAKPGQVIVSDATEALLGGRFLTRPVGQFQPKGIARSVTAYEILGRAPSITTAEAPGPPS